MDNLGLTNAESTPVETRLTALDGRVSVHIRASTLTTGRHCPHSFLSHPFEQEHHTFDNYIYDSTSK